MNETVTVPLADYLVLRDRAARADEAERAAQRSREEVDELFMAIGLGLEARLEVVPNESGCGDAVWIYGRLRTPEITLRVVRELPGMNRRGARERDEVVARQLVARLADEIGKHLLGGKAAEYGP